MQALRILATEANLPEAGGGAWIVWVLIAVAIVALWLMIRNTRKKAYKDYWDRKRAEEERRLNDPDMKKPED
jgi:hypothetical protein